MLYVYDFSMLSFANLSINCFCPQLSNITVAFLLGPLPSTFDTVPCPNLA